MLIKKYLLKEAKISVKMKIIKIVLVLLLILNLIILTHAEIEVSYPEEVYYGEVFEAKIILKELPMKSYDVKFDINENKRIAKILNGESWVSTNYYSLNIIKQGESEGIVKLNITTKYEGEAQIKIRLRENGKTTSQVFDGYKITVKLNEEKNKNVQTEIKEENKEQEIINKNYIEEEKEVIIISSKKSQETEENKVISEETKTRERINLTPQSIKTEKNKELIYESNTSKIKKYAIYGFALFCIGIIILLIIDRKR
jgi:hypothetical protein